MMGAVNTGFKAVARMNVMVPSVSGLGWIDPEGRVGPAEVAPPTPNSGSA